MDIEKRQLMEDFNFQLRQLETKEQELQQELEKIRAEKKQVLKQISENSDEKYQEDMLSMLYEQRRKK